MNLSCTVSDQPMLKVLNHRVLYREKRFYAAFPSIVRFSDNNLLLAFRRARDGLWLLSEEKWKACPFQLHGLYR